VEQEEPEPEEPEPEEEPPELEQESEELDLGQIEAMLAEGFGEGVGPTTGIDIDLSNVAGGKSLDELFAASDLDSKPTPIHQPPPRLSANENAATPGRVVVIFIIDSKGRVQQPKVTSSSNPALEAACQRTVKKWRYQPPSRDGKPVSTRSRQQIDFPKQK
jgi:TonB family protein